MVDEKPSGQFLRCPFPVGLSFWSTLEDTCRVLLLLLLCWRIYGDGRWVGERKRSRRRLEEELRPLLLSKKVAYKYMYAQRPPPPKPTQAIIEPFRASLLLLLVRVGYCCRDLLLVRLVSVLVCVVLLCCVILVHGPSEYNDQLITAACSSRQVLSTVPPVPGASFGEVLGCDS